MKKFLLLLCLTAIFYNANAQQTYYWVGGTGPVTFNSNARWNTALNGSGTTRVTADTTDILIIDGTNVGGTTPTTGAISATVTSAKIGQLKLRNNASLTLSRPTGGTSGTVTITGGTGVDFEVPFGSSFTNNSLSDSGNLVIVLQGTSTGLVSGNMTITGTGANRITVQSAGALVFDATAVCNVSTQPAASSYVFGSATQGVEKGIVFMAGSTLNCASKYSPMGGTSTYMAIDFKSGSNYYIKASNAASTGSWTSNKVFGNVFIQNGATLTADGSNAKIENFTIDNGCAFITHTSGQTPVTGHLTVNGSLTSPAASTNVFIMGGSNPQTVTGTGTFSPANFTVADNSNVILAMNVVTTGSNTSGILGKLDFSTKVLSGTSNFSSRVAATAGAITGNTVAGSTIITGVVGTLSGNVGLTISGAGIPANTNVIYTSSANGVVSMSQPATATATGVALTFASAAPTLTTAHPGGFDSTSGCVIVTGTKSYGSGTNYVINNLTYNPVGISTNAGTSMTVGNLTLNAPIITNYNTRVTGTLTLNNGLMNIRATDTIRISSGNDIAGGSFSLSKYIVTNSNASRTGVLRIDTFFANKLFPVGTPGKYLPVTVTPVTYNNICVSVFEGATLDGTKNGAALSAAQKANIVDAVWVINSTSGSGPYGITLNWNSSLEGATFAGLSNSEIGISRHDGTAWTTSTAVAADNTANYATSNPNGLGSFGVGKLGEPLPVKLSNISATVNNRNVEISWTSFNEINIKEYIIERSMDGRNYATVGKIEAFNVSQKTYNYVDKELANGNYFYRVVVAEKSGKNQTSNIVKVSVGIKPTISLFPNPAQNKIVLTGIETGSRISFINALGKEVKQQMAIAQTQAIDISGLSNGVWLVKIIAANGNTTNQSFIKQ